MKPYRKTKNKKRNKSKKIKGGLFTKLRELSEGASQVASVVGLKTAPKHVYGKKVGTPYATFMGDFASLKYSKYDQKYDPANPIKFGNLNSPNLAGNW